MSVRFLDVPAKLMPLFESDKMFNVAYGGRGSGKTETMALLSIVHSYRGGGKMLIIRYTANSIAESAKSTIEKWIHDLKLSHEFVIKKTTIINKTTGAEFIFRGLSKTTMGSIASIDNAFFVWIDEAHDIPLEAWIRLYPSIRGKYSNGDFAKFYITFNPHKEEDTFYQWFVKNPDRDDTMLININHADNPYFEDSSLHSVYLKDLKFMSAGYINHIWEGGLQEYNDEPVIDINRITRFEVDKILKRFQAYARDGKQKSTFKSLLLSVDTAYSVKEHADYSVIGTFAQGFDDDIYLLRLIRGHWEFGDLTTQLRYAYKWCCENYGTPEILIEDKASGQSLIQELEKSTSLKIHKHRPTIDKYARLNEVLPLIHGGRFKVPLSTEGIYQWVKAYLLELELFRADMKHDHDDQVDVTTQALMYFNKRVVDYGTIINVVNQFKMKR